MTNDYGSSTENANNKQTLRLSLIIWGAMLMSQLIFASIGGSVAAKAQSRPDFEPAANIDPILGIIAGLTAVASFALPRFLSNLARAKRASTNALKPDLTPAIVPFILGLALSEAVTVFGLARASMTADFKSSLPYFVVGFILVALRFPNEERLKNLAGYSSVGPGPRIR